MAESSYVQGDPDRSATAVPFSDDDTESDARKKVAELDEEDSPTASPVERTERRRRRQERLQRMLQEGEANATRVRELEERDQKRERELAELRGMVAANNNALQRQVPPGKDPYEARLDAVYARQGEAYNAAQAELKAGTFTAERQAHYERIAREIETEKTSIHTERAVAMDRESRRAEQAQQVWVQKYPEVYGNQKAYAYAEATWKQRQALGEQPTTSLVDEVMQDAMTRFKLGTKPAPTASDRARMSGIPASGGGGKGAPSGIDFTSNPALKRMALAAHSDLPEAEALKKWTQSTGKRLRDKKLI
jgi:hypothetical protein